MAIKVKICGLTNVSDAQFAIEAGADFLGFILYPKSPRFIAPDDVALLLKEIVLPPHVQSVGVFVNTPINEIKATLDVTGLNLAQLHGDEPLQYLAVLNGRGFKAVRPADTPSALQSAQYISYPDAHAPQLLLDAYVPNAFGGTGHRADWILAASVAQQTPRMLLAGGLTASTVHEAIRIVCPWGVDVASGVEAFPGRKDHEQVRAFIENARRPS